jgi:hypothetical protein
MKKERKFTFEKFEVAKLKNLKKITGGEDNQPRNTTNDDGITDIIKKLSSNVC